MRLDKYLKVSRLIKRRTLAKEASEADRILINGKIAKPSKEVNVENTTGLFIIPNSPMVDVAGTSAGWIVAKNFKNTS